MSGDPSTQVSGGDPSAQVSGDPSAQVSGDPSAQVSGDPSAQVSDDPQFLSEMIATKNCGTVVVSSTIDRRLIVYNLSC